MTCSFNNRRPGAFPHLLACAGLFASLVTSPLAAAESDKSVIEKKPESGKQSAELPPNTKIALKLAGLVTFVAGSCPDLKPDYARFKSAVGALGVSVADLEKTELKGGYLSYMLRYKEDPAKNCARALKDFGPGGTVVSDLVRPNR